MIFGLGGAYIILQLWIVIVCHNHTDGSIVAAAGIDGPDLGGMGMRRAVGSEDAIGAESIVVLDTGQLAQVAPCGPTAVFQEALIHSIPNEATLQLGVLVDSVPIVLETAHRVAHGMAVFGNNIWTFVLRVVGIL